MRVTHIITRLVVGGAQENTVSTVLGLLQQPEFRADLVSGPSVGPEGSMESAFAPHPDVLTIVPQLVRPVHPWKDILALRRLTGILRERKPDIVHTHSGKAGILGRMAARKASTPVTIHHIHGPSFGPFQGLFANALFSAAERHAGKLTTHFVCSANAMARLYLNAGIGKPEMYTRVFSGFKVEPFLTAENDLRLRHRLGLAPNDFVIGKIGRLATLKGHADALEVLSRLLHEVPNARMLFIGGGELMADLKEKSASLGISDKVVFTGLVPPCDVPQYAGVMDCLIHLSSREAVSRALPQALAARKPVVAYAFDGADEVCIENETGFLARGGDVPAVCQRLLDLARSSDLRLRLGSAGQAFVRKEFPVEVMIEKLVQLYMRLSDRGDKQSGA
jgi:glycosyltransferase involved in cell wall biosynthesis